MEGPKLVALALACLVSIAGASCGPKKELEQTVSRPAVLSTRTLGISRGWYLRYLVAEELGDVAEAERALEWMVRLDAKSIWPHLALGALLEERGRFEEAIESYYKALNLEPKDGLTNLAMGKLLLLQRQGGAHHWLRLSCRSGEDEACYLLLRDLSEKEELVEAREILSLWQAPDPQWIGDWAVAALRLKEPSLAVDQLLAAPDIQSGEFELLLEAGLGSCRIREVWQFGRRRQPMTDSWDETALRLAGVAKDRVWQGEIIERRYQAGIEPERWWSFLIEEERYGEAIAVLEGFVGNHPDNGRVLFDLGRCYRGLSRFDEAHHYWAKVPSESDWGPAAIEAQTRLLLDQGRVEDALERAERALTERSDQALLLWSVALARQRQGDIDGAEHLLRSSEVLTVEQLCLRLARLRQEHGDMEGALAVLRQGADENHLVCLMEQARLLERRGRVAEALVVWRELVDKDPKNAGAWVEISRLSADANREALRQALGAD
ncbi:MAG: tetratricopeptide repeat protein, partial [Proteobacteria bacterium]|nr:tetratricopeptide repeat protein [Pseudomonadota bacterium]